MYPNFLILKFLTQHQILASYIKNDIYWYSQTSSLSIYKNQKVRKQENMFIKFFTFYALISGDQIAVNRLGNNIYFHLQSRHLLPNFNFFITARTLQRSFGKELEINLLRSPLEQKLKRKIYTNIKLQMFLKNQL